MVAIQPALVLFLLFACMARSMVAFSNNENHVIIAPQSPVVEIGTNFTATCVLNTSDITADNLYWQMRNIDIPKEQYTKINESALNVTITITVQTPEWLFCKCNLADSERFNRICVHGILLVKKYFPEKPQNLSCMAIQAGSKISPNISCVWEPGKRSFKETDTKYTLFAENTLMAETQKQVAVHNNSAQVAFDIFPNVMRLDIWVEAENELGKVQSKHLVEEAEWFVKTHPPMKFTLIADHFTTSLLLRWQQPINKEYVKLEYQIRYCSEDCQKWTLVQNITEMESYRLQYLRPHTKYISQIRCKYNKVGYGYWSDWSSNATAKTPEDFPRSEPDLWRIISPSESRNKRRVQFICKDPVLSNGEILNFSIRLQKEWETFVVNKSDSEHSYMSGKIFSLRQIEQLEDQMLYVEARANNSAGSSPMAAMVILYPTTEIKFPKVQSLNWWADDGQLWLEWQRPNITDHGSLYIKEYVVQWVSAIDGRVDWQRVPKNTTRIAVRGNLEKFKLYNVSVYPLYALRPRDALSRSAVAAGGAVLVPAYMEQGVPLEGPSVALNDKPGKDEAKLVWKEIPLDKQRGFITNYTIYYRSAHEQHAITVPANTYSYLLQSLSSDTRYVVLIQASTIKGRVNGTEHSFSTLKYAPGRVEGIVVGVSFGFLLFMIVIISVCVSKMDWIKKKLWPQIPNPGNSSIGTWSPDFPSKASPAKESVLGDGVSVVEVDPCDSSSVLEEDKAGLPLRKDKYLSEEHSSGIGGSSCMSSPRQSVSDSDEGGEPAETTASTVQYSSVVAASGYKGQTPGNAQPAQPAAPPPHTFARSESTQPLLDCEESGDCAVGSEGSRQSHQLSPGFAQRPEHQGDTGLSQQGAKEQQGGSILLNLWPLDAEAGSAEKRAVRASSYMPQLGGYRPQ